MGQNKRVGTGWEGRHEVREPRGCAKQNSRQGATSTGGEETARGGDTGGQPVEPESPGKEDERNSRSKGAKDKQVQHEDRTVPTRSPHTERLRNTWLGKLAWFLVQFSSVQLLSRVRLFATP